MKKTTIGLIVIVAIIVISALWVMNSYNSFVTMNLNIDNAWSQVETQYQRRFDLVPNLVAATKGYLKQEQVVFGAIAEARTKYSSATSASTEKAEAINQYDSALSRLLVVMENYPELKSVETVRALTDELAGTENRVLVARNRYNDEVKVYNITIKRFPKNTIASMFNFDARDFFSSVEEAETAPKVEL